MERQTEPQTEAGRKKDREMDVERERETVQPREVVHIADRQRERKRE